MRRSAFTVVLATGALLLGPATSAPAQEEHGSCRAAGQFAASLAQQLGSGFGQAAASLAQVGQADDFVHSVHAMLCEPRP
jgi:hypothetical protein